MNIYIDADACPGAVKDILVRAANRTKMPFTFIANSPVRLPESEYTSMVVVEEGPDIADDKIVELVEEGDLVISEDIPLADRVITKGGTVITTRGQMYTKDNIKGRLSTRDLMEDLRNSGIETGGPSRLKPKDVRLFASALDSFLTKNR